MLNIYIFKCMTGIVRLHNPLFLFILSPPRIFPLTLNLSRHALVMRLYKAFAIQMAHLS